MFFKKESVKEAKVVSKIDNYGYVLKSNKSDAYKKLFKELSDNDINISKYEVIKPSLHEIFIEKVGE